VQSLAKVKLLLKTFSEITSLYRVSIKSFPDYKHLLQENTWDKNIYFFKCNSTQEVFLQHISALQHVLHLLRGCRLIDKKFISMCSQTCLQLL